MRKQQTLNRINNLSLLLNKAIIREVILNEDLGSWRASGPYDVTRLFSHENDILLKIARINAIQRRILISLEDQLETMYNDCKFKPLSNGTQKQH